MDYLRDQYDRARDLLGEVETDHARFNAIRDMLDALAGQIAALDRRTITSLQRGHDTANKERRQALRDADYAPARLDPETLAEHQAELTDVPCEACGELVTFDIESWRRPYPVSRQTLARCPRCHYLLEY